MEAVSRPIAGSDRRLIRSKGMTVISIPLEDFSSRHPPAIQPSTQITGRIQPPPPSWIQASAAASPRCSRRR